MNTSQIEAAVKALMESWSEETFILELLLAYGLPKNTITRLKKGQSNLSKEPGVVSLKNRVLFKIVKGQDLHLAITQAVNEANAKQRFVIVTDFKTLLAQDMSGKATPLEVPFSDLAKHYAYFLPWAGMEKVEHHNENPADRKAAEKLAKLYDDLKASNDIETEEDRHALNVFLTRLLFCLFAEDTGIFEEGLFTTSVGSHTLVDGSDTSEYLSNLFQIMGQEESERRELPAHLAVFPFVGKSLFGDVVQVPVISRRGRTAILDAGDLDWAEINPDIFGSMIQAVVAEDDRGELGMHYTSVPNIMKVIGPLFLDELYDEFEKAKGSEGRLRKLLHRIQNLKIFDPACGSGNFLIITYKELRQLEMLLLKEFQEQLPYSGIRLNNFYGIELDDFAHEAAVLSMWIAAFQMDAKFFTEFGQLTPPLPITAESQIIRGNACRLDWSEVAGKGELFVIGNPPYQGAGLLSKSQREDMEICFGARSEAKGLDYISCWFFKAANLGEKVEGTFRFAFVTTNSVCQGEQVSQLWPKLFAQNLEIIFAYSSFKWSNLAKSNAGVSVAIIALGRKRDFRKKRLFSNNEVKGCDYISPYLLPDIQYTPILGRRKSLALRPEILSGNRPSDGGHLILNTRAEYEALVNSGFPLTMIRDFKGSRELIHGVERWCLWVEDDELEEASRFNIAANRFSSCREKRLASPDGGAQRLAERPHQFRDRRTAKVSQLLIPKVSSERRDYIPVSFEGQDLIASDLLFIVLDASVDLFAILTSRIHMVWLQTVGGRLETRYRYSKDLVYNTFPFPHIGPTRRQELESCALRILEVRERYPSKTLADLYDPDKMPDDLREAHRLNDDAVDRCYKASSFRNDEERLTTLFTSYSNMIEDEGTNGSLFGKEKKPRKKK